MALLIGNITKVLIWKKIEISIIENLFQNKDISVPDFVLDLAVSEKSGLKVDYQNSFVPI